MILFLAGDVIEHQEHAAQQDIIEIVIFKLIGADIPFFVDEAVHLVLDVFEIPGVAGVVPEAFESFPDDTFVVGPADGGGVAGVEADERHLLAVACRGGREQTELGPARPAGRRPRVDDDGVAI